MRFWDSSALVPLLAEEASTVAMRSRLDEDRELLVWWGTRVECASALARRLREGRLGRQEALRAEQRLQRLSKAWSEVAPTDPVRTAAERLLRVHPLRAADALQLAAAVVAAEHVPASMELVTLDDRLAEAAELEGFRVLGT
ncbi:MAG TPA: PIN domain-containing protein [Anaeromyxobacteraceae bacterium]|nr:PIN domain-containing protein [Anaeromyxobacteraceae bacterium]